MGIHEQEELLFKDWIIHLKERMNPEEVENLWCPDGLHHTGIAEKCNQKYWSMIEDHKEEDLWHKARIRPLFLTKDHNLNDDSCGVDVRNETGKDNDTDRLYHRFYARYLLFLYGLTKINPEDGTYPSLEEAKDSLNELESNYYQFPVVRMNLKKIAGGNSCSNDDLQDYIDNDIDFIRRQIAIYQPNVIVCCHGGKYQPRWSEPDTGLNPMMMMLKNEIYPDMESVKFNEVESYNLYYSQKVKVLIIHEWHPSEWNRSYEDYYSPIPEVAKFLYENPDSIG